MDGILDILGGLFGGGGDGGDGLAIEGLIALLGSGLLSGSGFASPDIPDVGYQGEVTKTPRSRTRIPLTADMAPPNRRPGAIALDYFTDIGGGNTSGGAVGTDAQGGAGDNFVSGTGDVYQVDSGGGVRNRDEPDVQPYRGGGIVSLAQGGYMPGRTDGMADRVPAKIEGQRPAALSHGEFVIPADVVSHLGNGNSQAGADTLYQMMERVRKQRTGKQRQAPKINPNRMMPT